MLQVALLTGVICHFSPVGSRDFGQHGIQPFERNVPAILDLSVDFNHCNADCRAEMIEEHAGFLVCPDLPNPWCCRTFDRQASPEDRVPLPAIQIRAVDSHRDGFCLSDIRRGILE